MPDELVETQPDHGKVADAEKERVLGLFEPLFAEEAPGEGFPARRPLLAHYTSIKTLEAMLINGEIWLSNPLFMNDTQELRFGIFEGIRLFRNAATALSAACDDDARFRAIVHSFEYYADQFNSKSALDVYIFCLSEHDADDRDGKLSMWRGYGADGHGAAIVFDSSKVTPVPDSTLKIAKVRYESFERQTEILQGFIDQFIDIVRREKFAIDASHVAAWMLFRRMKYFSVTTKYRGFREEAEWRVVYAPELDGDEDTLADLIDYWIGPRGVEPKLKLKLAPLPGVIADDMVFEDLIDKIILGPTISTPLSHASVSKMLQRIGRSNLVERLWVSEIPFRSMRAS